MPRFLRVRLLLLFTIAVSPYLARAATLLEDDYSTFASGNLEGQLGYAQSGASSTLPIQVTNGQVVIPGGQLADNQDVYKNFTAPAIASETDLVVIYEALQLVVYSVPAGTLSYFSALNVSDAASFNNFRIAAREGSAPGFYQLGTRVTGQSGYPFAFGEDLLLNTPIQLVLEADLVAGPQNDEAKLFILPQAVDARTVDFSTLTPYAIAPYTGGSGTDPAELGSFVISQFGRETPTLIETAGLRIDATLIFTGIPEPAAGFALIGGALLLGANRRRS